MKDANGNHLYVTLAWPGRTVKIRIWQAMVGKVRLFLLDTDYDKNTRKTVLLPITYMVVI